MKHNILKYLSVAMLATTMLSCEDFLDKQPPSYVVPSDYYQTEDQVLACANAFYTDILPSHGNDGYGMFAWDSNTDNQAGLSADTKYVIGQWKVGMNNTAWSWDLVRNLNYQITTIEERLAQNAISGNEINIRYYLGEMYFLRAYRYFSMLKEWGDLPIITEALPDDEAILVAANKRMPRNEVARFILEQLDKSIEYMNGNSFDRTRVSPDAAQILKSRVALFEGSWLTYFKGTPFVPNGDGWPGKSKNYNADYQYPTGSIDEEIKYFLNIAVTSSEIIAEKYKGTLAKNTKVIPQQDSDQNPYFYLFGNTDLSDYSEVLLWREYSKALNVINNVESAVQWGNEGVGLTRSMVESFLMEDGKPIYASDYVYDDSTLELVRMHRDPRLFVFLKVPGQKNLFKNMDYKQGDLNVDIEPRPDITNGSWQKGYSTGYTIRKGGTFDRSLCANYGSYTAAICFRATEALLNYMEAQYMLTQNILSGKILEYWKIVRETAGFIGNAVDPTVTIATTDMTKETLDWGAYSGGQLIDATLYNIRRERRCELMAEGLRWMDLIRWRALDQLKTTPYHVEGFHLWNTPMQNWYNFQESNYDGSASANTSNPSLSEYLRLYQKNMTSGNLFRDGYTWRMAQYLQPLPIGQFLLTASDHTSVDKSPLYQNPYWPTEANLPALE